MIRVGIAHQQHEVTSLLDGFERNSDMWGKQNRVCKKKIVEPEFFIRQRQR